MTSYELEEFRRRINNASSKAELLEILKELREKFDENDPDVKELMLKLR